MKPIQETVLVHFIMYYAVLCINRKGTIQSHVNNVTSFLFYYFICICLLEKFVILLKKILCTSSYLVKKSSYLVQNTGPARLKLHYCIVSAFEFCLPL